MIKKKTIQDKNLMLPLLIVINKAGQLRFSLKSIFHTINMTGKKVKFIKRQRLVIEKFLCNPLQMHLTATKVRQNACN